MGSQLFCRNAVYKTGCHCWDLTGINADFALKGICSELNLNVHYLCRKNTLENQHHAQFLENLQ
jgi:hypothetical protein